jgi:hypothetical protein
MGFIIVRLSGKVDETWIAKKAVLGKKDIPDMIKLRECFLRSTLGSWLLALHEEYSIIKLKKSQVLVKIFLSRFFLTHKEYGVMLTP